LLHDAKNSRHDRLELVRALEGAGFIARRQKGSHLHLFRESDRRRVTVPIHKGKDIPIGTFKAILKDAGLTVDEFRKLL
jgi:predicted RNA binding protein YcfA (HicA-like mRNA interferase family)